MSNRSLAGGVGHQGAAFRVLRSLLLAGVATSAALAAGSAHAAQTDTTPGAQQQQESTSPPDQGTPADNDIIVTGSRIARAKITAQPTEVLGSDQISKRGYTNLGNALQELPAFSVPGNSPIGSQGSFSAGQSFVNLYNLGAQRTLGLVNGHRFVSSATSSIFGPVAGSPVDISSISPALVDRTEVLSVGGAPIYGSDAIAGTVNIILKKNFEGVQVNAQTGVAERGDGQDYNVSGLFGKNFSEDRGNVTLSVTYDRQKGVPTSDRFYTSADGPFTSTALPGRSYRTQLYFGGQRYNVFTNTGMPMVADTVPIYGGQVVGSITDPSGQPLYFDGTGHLVPFHSGQPTGSALIQAGGDGFRIRDYDNFLVDSHRIQGTLLAHYDFSDHLRFSGEAWLGRDTATNLRAQPYYNTALFGNAGDPNGNLVLSTSNPFLSAQDRATIISNLNQNGLDPSTFYLTRANTDLSTGAFTSQSDLWRLVGTLSGDFSAAGRQFNWEVTVNYGHNETRTDSRELVTQNYFNALNATTNGSGAIICAPGYTNAAIATFSSTCAPLDVFGVNQASKAAQDYITAPARTTQVNTQLDIVADINGSIVKLPGGDVKFSLGYEHRRESTNFDPGAFFFGQDNGDGTRTQYGNSIPIDPVSGSYYTHEAFGELNVPIVSPDMNIPFVRSLNLQAAGRYVHNSITGGFWAYTAGGTYSPVRDITFRGNYTRSFRAPAITEAFAPVGQVFDTANDPCDQRFIAGGPNPARRAANCAAAGITQPFTSDVADFTVKGTFGGNPNLQNETANSWTAGAVVEPRFLPGFSLSADYISIDVQNEIASLSLTDLMNACYDATDFSTNSFCNTFTRGPDHQVTSFAEGNYNIGIEQFRALQAELNYHFKLSALGLPQNAGTLGLGVNYLHTFSHFTKVGEGDTTYSVGSPSEPSDNFTANLNYDNGRLNFLWQTIYYGPTKVSVNVPETNYQYPNVGQYFLFNSSIGFEVNKNYSVRLIVNNVFDRGVPFPYVLSQASETRYYDAIMGRYFKFNVGVKF